MATVHPTATDWSALPGTALAIISVKLAAFSEEDYVLFRSVCSSWRAATSRRPRLRPFLVVHEPGGGPDSLFSFFRFDGESLRWSSTWSLPFRAPPSAPFSSCGWLTLLETDSGPIRFSNPVTGAQVQLPPFHGSFDQVVLSSSEPARSVALLCVYNMNQLWLSRPGDDVWISVEKAPEFHATSCVFDMVSHEDRIYLSDGRSIYVLSEIGSSSAARLERIPNACPSAPVFGVGRWFFLPVKEVYLLESFGELLFIDVYHGEDEPIVRAFQLFWEGDQMKHVRLHDLGDRSVFVGGSNSFALRASEFPGLKRNCIYRAYGRERNIRIFHLDSNRNELIENLVYFNDTESRSCAWFLPSFL